MTRDALRFLVGIIASLAAPMLTGAIIAVPMPKGAYEAAIVLCTLAWQRAGDVIRSLFPAPEIDVVPPAQKDPGP